MSEDDVDWQEKAMAYAAKLKDMVKAEGYVAKIDKLIQERLEMMQKDGATKAVTIAPAAPSHLSTPPPRARH